MKKILVIEDDPCMRWLLERMLNNELEKVLPDAYEVSSMPDGMAAWAWLSEGNMPDLIIEDVNMPLLNGVEFLENLTISGLHRNIPVLVLSGLDNDLIKKQCLDLGACGYMVKPFQPQQLLEEINHILVSEMFL